MTARRIDQNGWIEISRNPITRPGVYDYSGAQLGLSGLDAVRTFAVLRPPEELASPEFLASLSLLPIVDDHEMLGHGETPAEDYGVHGAIGQDAEYDDTSEMVVATIKLFSTALARAIRAGKKQLSLGYRCKYVYAPGTWRGKAYDYIQREPRGNHLALVREGRMGPEVAVLDQFVSTVDAMEGRVDPEKLKKVLEALQAAVAILGEAVKPEAPEGEDGDMPTPAAPPESEDADTPAPAAETPTPEGEDTDEPKPEAGAMDAALRRLARQVADLSARPVLDEREVMRRVAARDGLVRQLVPHIGVFDHAEMTHADVVAYGVRKLGLAARKGHEVDTLNGFLAARQPARPAARTASDAAPTGAAAKIGAYAATKGA